MEILISSESLADQDSPLHPGTLLHHVPLDLARVLRSLEWAAARINDVIEGRAEEYKQSEALEDEDASPVG